MREGWVTVIAVFHNREALVSESLGSIVTQSYPKTVIEFIDDASTDGTFARAQSEFSNLPNVHLTRNDPNKGFTRSLIDSIRNSDTEFVAIHGAGDLSSRNRIARQVEVMTVHPEVGLVTALPASDHRDEVFFTTEDLIARNRVIHGSALFRRAAYDEVGGYREFFFARQDKDLWLRMSLHWKICGVSSSLYRQQLVENSVSRGDPGKVVPMLLSDYSVHLIRQRMRFGTDDLEKHGAHGALCYRPTSARRLFLRNIRARIRAGEMMASAMYVRGMASLEGPFLRRSILTFCIPAVVAAAWFSASIRRVYSWLRR